MVLNQNKFTIFQVSGKKIMDAVQAAWHTQNQNGIESNQFSKYSEISEVHAKRVLDTAVKLGLLLKTESKYLINPDTESIISTTEPDSHLVFGQYLAKFPPFTLFVTLLARSGSKVSARKVSAVCNLGLSASRIQSVFVSWGLLSGLLKRTNGREVGPVHRTEIIDSAVMKEIQEAVLSEANAHAYLANRIGTDSCLRIQQRDLQFIVSAIQKSTNKPRDAVRDFGTAFEDILRDLCDGEGINTSNLNGIGGLANKLLTNKSIHTKHYQICQGLNALRIAAVHGKDKETGKLWSITPNAALETVLLGISIIHSIHSYVFRNGNHTL